MAWLCESGIAWHLCLHWLHQDIPGSIAQYRPDMEKRAEWPARGRPAVSPFPGDILRSSPVHVFPRRRQQRETVVMHTNTSILLLNPCSSLFKDQFLFDCFVSLFFHHWAWGAADNHFVQPMLGEWRSYFNDLNQDMADRCRLKGTSVMADVVTWHHL